MDSLIKILASNSTEAEEKNINRLKATIENLQEALRLREEKLAKLKRRTQKITTDPSMQIAEPVLVTA